MADDRRRRLLAANKRFYDAFSNHNAEAMERLWARHHPVACIHPGWPPLADRQAVIQSWRDIFRNGGPLIDIQGARIVFDGDIAMVLCFEMVGGQLLVATNLFVDEDGDWRLIHHQASGVVMDLADPPSAGRSGPLH